MLEEKESGGEQILADVRGLLCVLVEERGPIDHGEALADKEV